MKKIYSSFCSSCLITWLFVGFMMTHFPAQAQDALVSNVSAALRAGSSKDLSRHFNDGVEISIDDHRANYGLTQAEFVIKDFFKKHPPGSFDYLHQGESKEGLRYAMGRYTYAGGVFRVYMVMKQYRGNYLIDTITFTKE